MFDLILILKCNRVNVYDGVPFGILYVGPGWKYPQYSLSKSVANLFLSLLFFSTCTFVSYGYSQVISLIRSKLKGCARMKGKKRKIGNGTRKIV